MRSRHPGVSRRQRSSSMGTGEWEMEVRAAIVGKGGGTSWETQATGAPLVHTGLAPGVSKVCYRPGGLTPDASPGIKPGDHPSKCRITNHTFAGRSASRRMYHGNQCVP